MGKRKILIIDKHQLGTITDIHKWCEYLRNDYSVSLICFDTGKEKMQIDGIDVKYVPYYGNYIVRGFRFLCTAIWNILFFNGKILVVYFEGCEWLKIIYPLKKMIVDIRTLSVSKDVNIRRKYDLRMRKACRFFDLITVVSEGVRTKLRLCNKHVEIMPLGADVISEKSKNFTTLKLLYVGTFAGRDLYKTIEAFSIFIKNNKNVVASYDIIGDGFNNELEEYKDLAMRLGISDKVCFHGRLPYDKLKPYFDKCNIGVSFVPMTEYYDVQPPTKTFEYVLSGLYTIATATSANKELVTNDNGILINDSVSDFVDALSCIWNRRDNINEIKIRESLKEFSWKRIVSIKLISILADL